MRNIIIAFTFVFSIGHITAQKNFYGEIEYEVNYSNLNIGNLNSDELTLAMGSKEKLFIQKGSHLTKSNGLIMDWVLFKNNESKLFFKMKDEKEIHFKSSELFDKKIHKVEYFYDEFEILGYNCKKIAIVYKDGTKVTSFYAEDLFVDSKDYENFLYDGFYFLLSKTNSISLKTIYESKEYTKTITASKVEKKEIPSQTFELPKDIKVIKAPW